MKRGTPEHPKTLALGEAICQYLTGNGCAMPLEMCEALACGLLERLWHFTARYAPAGDIGKHSNVRIAKSIGWVLDADWLIETLLSHGWLDDDTGRLFIHDWHEHSDEFADRWLADRGEFYANGAPPRNKPRKGSKAFPDKTPHVKPPAIVGPAEPEVEDAPPEVKAIYSAAFLEWFNAYPKKVAKGRAATAYTKALKKIQAEKGLTREQSHSWLLDMTVMYASSPKGRGEYCPNPATWLNDASFDDDPSVWHSRQERSSGRPSIAVGSGQRYAGE